MKLTTFLGRPHSLKKGDIITFTGYYGDYFKHIIIDVDQDNIHTRPATILDRFKAFFKKWWSKLTYKLI